MRDFKVFFRHGPPVVVRAASGEQARKLGMTIAAEDKTVVTKVKLVKQVMEAAS